MRFFAIIITHVLFNLVKCQPYKMYEHINKRYIFFSKKTVYSYVSAVTPYPEPNCEVLHLWMLSRHGTRNPKLKTLKKFSILTQYQNIDPNKSWLRKEEIEAIKSWRSEWNDKEESMLNHQGVHDMRSLGQRLRTLYTDLFKEKYCEKNFKVIASPQQRCFDSAHLFLNAAFNIDVEGKNIKKMLLNDNRFNIFTRVNKLESEQEKEFLNSNEMKELIQSVTKAVGSDLPLSLQTVKLMYEACRVQKSSKVNFDSPWCAVFSVRDFKILEYYHDLKYYYSHGYGYQEHIQLSLDILVDMFRHLRLAADRKPGPKGVFYFGHTSNLFSILVGIGYAKDTSLMLSANFESMHDRKWRMSYIDPFAANVRAVLYDCNGDLKAKILVISVFTYFDTRIIVQKLRMQ